MQLNSRNINKESNSSQIPGITSRGSYMNPTGDLSQDLSKNC